MSEATVELNEVAKVLKELGHATRLSIYKCVVRAGFQGVAVGTIQEQLQIPGSTLSHHISNLMSAGLISQRREGRTLYCVAEYEQLNAVIGFLNDECCADEQQTVKAS
ncbi:ArsR/SmtB family transcription factor [Ferrimonas senticii]|uniref:ArsR/SmtB family transcription factor n=1 Tax=Ferrimonas senticii TaxID=394566 RepID=UPI003B830530